MLGPQRYTRVGWLWNSDLDAGRAPAWTFEQYDEHLSCWPISRYPDRSSLTGYLIVHAIKGNGNDGGMIALACSDVPHYDWYAHITLGHVPAQSGSKRHRYRIDADWWREEGA